MDLSILDQADARLAFSEKSHRYTLDGKPVPGVTTIIGSLNAPALNAWQVKQEREACITAARKIAECIMDDEIRFLPRHGHEDAWSEDFRETFEEFAGKEYEGQRIAREAADVGSQLHALIEGYCKGKLGIPFPEPRVSDEAHAMFSTWLQWARSQDFQPLAVERRVFSVKHWYAGTVDLFAYATGRKVIFDWKGTKGKKLYARHRLQSIAYRKAAEEMGLGEWDGQIVVVPTDGSAAVPLPVDSDPEEDFRAFLACRTLYEYAK